MRIVVLMGSPNKNGSTGILVENFVQGATEAGHTCEEFDICHEYKRCMGRGIIKVSGCSAYKLIRNLIVNYAGSVSAKDPVWKYKWVENNEPDVYRKIYKWLDIGDYLVARCTGRIVRTADSAFGTFFRVCKNMLRICYKQYVQRAFG